MRSGSASVARALATRSNSRRDDVRCSGSGATVRQIQRELVVVAGPLSLVEKQIACDRQQIGLERFGAEPIAPGPGADKGLGCQVVGETGVAAQPQGESVDILKVGSVDVIEGQHVVSLPVRVPFRDRFVTAIYRLPSLLRRLRSISLDAFRPRWRSENQTSRLRSMTENR